MTNELKVKLTQSQAEVLYKAIKGEQVEIKTISLKANNGNHIRKATRLVIDGQAIDFTELLTKAQVQRYLADRERQQHQAAIHAQVESYGG